MGLFDIFKKNNKSSEIPPKPAKKEYTPYKFGYFESKFTKDQVKALFLQSIDYPCPIKENSEYPRYMTTAFHILNVNKYHQEILKSGYLEFVSFHDAISRLKVSELKELAEQNNLPTKKLKKDDLVTSLSSNLSKDQKNQIIKDSNLFVLSLKAREYLNAHKEFLALYNHQREWGISYKDYLKFKEELPSHLTFNDVVWHILGEMRNSASLLNDFTIVRTKTAAMAGFLEKENKHIDSLYYYLQAFWFDMNLMHLQEYLYKHIKEGLYNREMLLDWLSDNFENPWLIQTIHDKAEFFQDEMIDKIYSYQLMPFVFIDKESFKKMTKEIFESSVFDSEKYKKAILKNAKAEIIKHAKP